MFLRLSTGHTDDIYDFFCVCNLILVSASKNPVENCIYFVFKFFSCSSATHTHTARAKNDQKQFGDCFVQMENVGLQKYGYNIAIARL